ncbi:DUF4388 domain-containing protein [Chamaesiphon minutus]|uniref:PatA-like N-terminal domain-containing protein n=1 Tax=Chamaesiphon minutus (strain ATCC 27169 / PCC 6605) TaxID=1173020 RepID=K9UGB2_CHAP6|nr:DUF4388 domain-containing protein [Chamaesiphon minutus]AFY93835.1 hypothetical protein Cha6605_2798 [Chamaesiphon minutus PCC 6605]
MSLAGYLSEYSLAEIFHFVQEGNKSGLLSIEPERGAIRSHSDTYYISFQGGRIMSVANSTGAEHLGLLKMMEQRRWLTPEKTAQLEAQSHLLRQPLGTYLKSTSLINTEQLTLAFNSQVIATTCKLFEIHHGRFKFDPHAPLNYVQMTGLSLDAKEVALLAMRMLKDWSGLSAKLPDPESALQRLFSEPNGLRLDSQEFRVWNLCLGELAISKIAKKVGLEIATVQQIGFRLSSIGLVQEVSAEPIQPDRQEMEALTPVCVGGGNATVPVSTSFLSNLMGFLKKKG